MNRKALINDISKPFSLWEFIKKLKSVGPLYYLIK